MSSSKLSIQPPIIAHRGASLHAPENTLAAFRKAKELGLNWVEFDVMLTSDNEVVVIHDKTLNRTTTGKGKVFKKTLPYLQTLDAGSWFNQEFAEEKVPTLSATIDLLNQLDLAANIEIKTLKGKEELTVKKILQLITANWQNSTSPPLLSSFSLPLLKVLRKNSAEAVLGFLMDRWNKKWETICDTLNCSAVNTNYRCLTLDRVQKIKSTQRLLLAYTVNNAKVAQKLFSWGVDAIFSDCPSEILSMSNVYP